MKGSERQKHVRSDGRSLKEGASIGKSLAAVGTVVSRLVDASRKAKGTRPAFIPYRDSKLTRVLKQSFDGVTLTTVICTVVTAPIHREETVSTLKFGLLCRGIRSQVKSGDATHALPELSQVPSLVSESKALPSRRSTIHTMSLNNLYDRKEGRVEKTPSPSVELQLQEMSGLQSLIEQVLRQKGELEAKSAALQTLTSPKEGIANDQFSPTLSFQVEIMIRGVHRCLRFVDVPARTTPLEIEIRLRLNWHVLGGQLKLTRSSNELVGRLESERKYYFEDFGKLLLLSFHFIA